MSLGSTAAKQGSILNDYGDGHGTATDTTWEIAIYDGDPTAVGTSELTGTGGIDRATVNNDSATWTFTGGVLGNAVEISHPGTATAPWAAPGRWVATVHPTSGDLWDIAKLASPISVAIDDTIKHLIGDLGIARA